LSSFRSALRWEAIHAWSAGRALSRWSAAELPREAVARRIVGVAAMGVPAGFDAPWPT